MCSFIVFCVVVALIVAFGPKATSSSRLNDLRIASFAQGRQSSGLSHLRCLCPDAGLPLVGDTMRGAAFLRNPDSLLASQRESGFSSNPCKTCKWLVPGTEPQCGFYKTSYTVLGTKLVVHEYAEHVRKNEHMCGEEGYMHEPLEENDTTLNPFAYALPWPLNVPLAVLTGLVEFLADDDAAILMSGRLVKNQSTSI